MFIKSVRNPSSLDKEPYKTWWFADVPEENMFIYMQISQDEDQPKWVKLNNIIEGIPHIIFDSIKDLTDDYFEEGYEITDREKAMCEAVGKLSNECLSKE